MTAPPHKPTIPEVIPWIKEYYAQPGNANGGYLHIVTEDGNTEARWLPILEKDAFEAGDYFGAFLCRVLSQMSRGQRNRLHRDHSFYPPGWP